MAIKKSTDGRIKVLFGKVKSHYKAYGFKGLIKKSLNFIMPEKMISYQKWYLNHRVSDGELSRERKRQFEYSPKVSILVSISDSSVESFELFLKSLFDQTYGNWELCLVCMSELDENVKSIIETVSKNQIQKIKTKYSYQYSREADALNKALSMATGEYILPSGLHSFYEPNFLYEVVNSLQVTHHDFIYTDEDLYNSSTKEFSSPRFKPDFNIDLLRSTNYILYSFLVNRQLVEEVNGFHYGYGNEILYDFILRCVESALSIHHIPGIFTHYDLAAASVVPGSVNNNDLVCLGCKAVSDHLTRSGIQAKVEPLSASSCKAFRVFYENTAMPKVSIIIPNCEMKETLKKCIDSLLSVNRYKNIEIIIVENNSTSPEIWEYYRELTKLYDFIKIISVKTEEFNYSALNNYGVKHATGEYILLLNNDTELISPDGIEDMVNICSRDDVGVVGAKLLYEDDNVQHAGVIIGLGGIANHAFVGLGKDDPGYMSRARLTCDYSAVTAACLMTSKKLYDQVGGLEEDLKVAFNDIDYCLKIRKEGKLVVWDAFSLWHHYESKSRGSDNSGRNSERLALESSYFRKKWMHYFEDGDPYYNDNFDLLKQSYML